MKLYIGIFTDAKTYSITTRMKRTLNTVAILYFLGCNVAFSQTVLDHPKLVVGIVVDQMRQEYLYRYYDQFGYGGFKRIMEEGFMAKNMHYNYTPTYTGPGHASVYTGTTPAVHGIIGNSWYSKKENTEVYCAGDGSANMVGTVGEGGKVSPHRMLTSTITDELRLSNQMNSKVIGISIKDRGASLPAGHIGNAAYWFDSGSGDFVSSTYYMEKLPLWVINFNDRQLSLRYLSQSWETSLPIDRYIASGPDKSPYEVRVGGKERPTFPYDLKEMTKDRKNYGLLTATPFGNDLVTEMALAAIQGEDLGRDLYTDFLALSFSSTDIAGHAFGPNAVEIEDLYIKLDKNMERLLNTLDEKVGRESYLLFITADHAVADVPQRMIDLRIPAGYFRAPTMKSDLNAHLTHYYGEGDWITNISNRQVFLNRQLIHDKKLSLRDIEEKAAEFLRNLEGVALAYTAHTLIDADFDEGGMKGLLVRGFHQKRSGDVVFELEPAWLESNQVPGTTHGSAYTYDTHVPMLWLGWGIRSGFSNKYYAITDIAPTLAMLLDVKLPNGCTGHPILEVLE